MEVKAPEEGDSKLLEAMVFRNYPEFQEDDFAKEKAVFNDGLDSVNSSECGFDYFSIPAVTYDELVKKDDEDLDEKRAKVLEKLENLQISDDLIKSEIHSIKRASPSHLEESQLQESHSENLSNKNYHAESIPPSAENLYSELSEIISKYSGQDSDDENENLPSSTNSADENTETLLSEKFAATDFGTLVHDYLNKMCLGIDIKTYEAAPTFFKNLDKKDAEKIRQICIKMCDKFAETEFYDGFKKAKNSGRFAESELEFKYFDEESQTLFHGSIDLIYETEDKNYVILDYKTDQKIRPEKHFLQQKCYKNAAEDLVPEKGNFKCFLYYLRFDKELEITEML